MAHTKHRAWRDLKRAGQVTRTGPVFIVSDDEPANEPLTQDDFALASGFAGPDADYPLQRAVDERQERR